MIAAPVHQAVLLDPLPGAVGFSSTLTSSDTGARDPWLPGRTQVAFGNGLNRPPLAGQAFGSLRE